MPHVVIDQTGSLESFIQQLQPWMLREDTEILRVREAFLSRLKTEAVLESIVIEGGVSRSFFTHLTQKESAITVRLLPLTDPEKTHGVKRLLAHIGKQIRDFFPGSHYGKTNLQDFL